MTQRAVRKTRRRQVPFMGKPGIMRTAVAGNFDGLEDVREAGCEVGGQEAGGTADTSAPVRENLDSRPGFFS